MLRRGDVDGEHDAVAQLADGLLELGLELGDDLRVAAQAHLVLGLIARPRAKRPNETLSARHETKGDDGHSQPDQARLRPCVGGTTTAADEVLEDLTARADERAVEPVLDGDHDGRLLADLIRDRLDGGLGGGDGLLRPVAGDLRALGVGRRLVEVDLRASLVLDLVDRGAALAEDAGDRARGDGELDDVVGFLLKLDGLGRRT